MNLLTVIIIISIVLAIGLIVVYVKLNYILGMILIAATIGFFYYMLRKLVLENA